MAKHKSTAPTASQKIFLKLLFAHKRSTVQTFRTCGKSFFLLSLMNGHLLFHFGTDAKRTSKTVENQCL